MEDTIPLLFSKTDEGEFIVPDYWIPKTTSNGINYIIHEENDSN